MYYTQLNFSLWKYAFNGICKAPQVVNTGNKNILNTTLNKIIKDLQPKGCAFIFPQVKAKDFLTSVDVNG